MRGAWNRIAVILIFGTLAAVMPANAQVWSNGYGYRSTITIAHTKVPNTDQANFPVLVSGTFSALATTSNGGNVTNSNGYDIIFTSDAAGSTVLPFEQESYNPSTGAIIYWVQLPTVSHTSDTVFYMFYGNASVAADQSNKNGVWDSNYAGVWHLANGSTLSAQDSTSNGNNGTIAGATATTGQVDGGAKFNGTSQYIDAGNGSSLQITGNAVTVEAWFYTSELYPSQSEKMVTKEMPSNANPYVAYAMNRVGGSSALQFGIATGGAGTYVGVNTPTPISTNSWNHVVGTYDGSHVKIYYNGAYSNETSASGNIASTAQHLVIGADTAANEEYFDGNLDEVRVSNVARSADWISTEYANESSPSTFLTVGSGQAGTITPPNISSMSVTSGPAGTLVTITGTGFGSTQGTSTVAFNGTIGSPTSWSDTNIVVPVPSGATTGPIVVSLGAIGSNGVTFTVIPTPTISNMSSTSGPVGIPITMTGSNFGSTQGSSTITFNGTSATATSWGSTAIQTTVPSSATTGNVVVTVNSVPSSGTLFTVTTGPGILSLSPASGLAGTFVTIVGENFGTTQGSSTVSYNGTELTPASWSDTSIVAAVPTGASTAPFVVTVAGEQSNSATFTVTPLPPGWNDSDIGSVGATGSASFSNGTFTVSGSGYLSGGSDTTNFAYQSLSGDGSIVARIVSASTTSGTPEVGVMIRETLNANASTAAAGNDNPDETLWYRTGTGANISSQSVSSFAPPYWVELIRSGNTFTSYGSYDGEMWTQVGSTQTITMAQTVYIGLFVSSQSGSGLATAKFDNVSINTNSTPAPTVSSVFPGGGSVGTHVLVSGSGFGSTQQNSMVVLNGTPLTITSWSDTSIVATIPSGATSGPMAVVVAPNMIASNPELFLMGSQVLSSWTDADINYPTAAGSASYSNGQFTLSGGTYTWGGSNFLFQPLTSDGTIVARLVSVSGTDGASGPATGGIMIRQTLDSESQYANVTACSGCAVYFNDVSIFGGGSDNQDNPGSVTLPVWLKLVRANDTFTAYTSADGESWVQVGNSQAIAMSENVEVGLGAFGTSYNSVATATFDNVSISTDGAPAPVVASLSASTGPVGTEVVITGAGFGSSQGSSIAWIGSMAATVNSWSDTAVAITIPTGASSGPISISVAPAMNDTNAFFFTVTSNPLPTPWLDTDVGAVGITGSATYSTSTSAFTVTASGEWIASYSDEMHFVYQPWSGDGTFVARVSGISGGYNPQAGVMVRESLDANSPEAFAGIQGSNTANATYFWYRPTLGASTSDEWDEYPATNTTPNWLKLTRSGNSFTAYESVDGVSWGQVGASQTIPMAQDVYVGLAATAYSNTSSTTITFDNVCIPVGTPPQCSTTESSGTAPSISSVSPPAGGAGASVTITGSNFGATQGSSTVTFNGVPGGVVAWNNWQIIAVVPTTAATGPVVVTAGSVASNSDLIYTVIQPQIYSASPLSAPVLGEIVLTGAGFGATQGNSAVQFAGTQTSPYIYSWSDSSISVRVPSGAVSGPVQVIVGGVFSNGASITVTGSLSVTAISPDIGLPGSSVTITGTGFGATQGSGTVALDGTFAVVTSWSNTSITATVAPGTLSGNVTVTVASLIATGPIFDVNGQTYLTDSLGNQTTYTSILVNGAWYVSQSNGSGCSTCSLRGTVENGFDASGDLTSVTDPRGYTTSYGYDSVGDITSVTQPSVSGGTPTTTYTYNDFGEVLTATDPLGHVTTNTYDANGNLLTVTTPAPASGVTASTTSFTYNGLGELTQITDPRSNIWKIAYTSAGMIYTITDPQNNVTTYGYDSRGNRTSITDALTHVTSFTYDLGNRLTQITYPDTSTTSFTYDSRGRRTSVTDQNSKTTTYAYDDADRLTSVTDPANNVTTYGYDTESNLTSITDANNHTTDFAYDAYGRVTSTTFPSTASETYGYDADNNLTSKIDRNGNTIDYVYDALNRFTEKDYPDTTKVEYTYDLVGKLMGVTDPSGTYGFTYDNMNRLTGTTAQYSFLSGTTFTNAYSYDAASNRTGYTAPDASTNTYSYDALNRLATLANSATGSFGFSYDALSRRTQMTRPNGINTNYSYDSLSRLLSVLHQSGTSTIDGASYTLDSAGNRTAKTDDYAGVTSKYTYDALYELTQVTQGSTTTESYSYDPVGNRTASHGVSSYTTNSSNEMTANSNASYSYDSAGNTLTETDPTGTTTYTWDYENRLTSVTLPASAGSVTFKYDFLGRRVYKQAPSATSIFIYDGDNLVETTNSSGSEVASYSQNQGIDDPLSTVEGTSKYYFEGDGLGSVTSLTDASGSLAETYSYDSFGRLTASSGSATNVFQYAAREFDTETGLYFDRARYYDPVSGKFISEDPAGFGAGDPNFYRYVFNQPVAFRDPTGYSCQCTYSISSGSFQCFGWGPHFVGPIFINTTGYSGYPPYVNNPFYDYVPGTTPTTGGPIPIGSYTFGPGFNGRLGKPEFRLKPINPTWFPANRDPGSFLIHGDNDEHNHTASNGCIVLPDIWARRDLARCDGGTLKVGP